MKKHETQEVLEKKGWKFTKGKYGFSATHKTGLKEYATTQTALFKKIRGY